MLDGEIIRPDNVRATRFDEIWRKSKYLDAIRNTECLKPPCASCNTKDTCNGGCRVNSLAFFGSPLFGDFHCPKVSDYYENKKP